MVDLLRRHHESGRRYEPNEFVEEGRRVAVGLTMTDARWQGESAQVYKVFGFGEGGDAVLLQDCVDRDDALAHLRAGTPRPNAVIVRESFDAFNAGDTEKLLAVMAPDFVMHLAEYPEPLGRDAWREGFEMMRRAFPDLEARVEDVIAADDKVAVRVRFRGTHRGEFQGIPATGRGVDYVSHEIYRVENGLFAEEWICSDTATLFRQLTEA